MGRGFDGGMKWKTRGLLIGGVLASIATSQIPSWELWSNDAPITSTTLDNANPARTYLVHAELRGPGPFEGLEGWVAAHLDVSPEQSTELITIEIRSITHPDQMPTTSMVPANVTHDDVYLDAWLDCPADPCAEDYEVTIRRDPALDLPPLQVTGYMQAYAGGPPESKEQPQNSEVVVTVTGPL
jgi:hypothetical protein